MNIEEIKKKKKIVMLTAYDYQTAKLLDEVGIDLILVGDSLGMVMLGYKDTKNVTMQEMIHHTKAVVRGAKNTPIIGDMPIHTYETVDDALINAKKFIEVGVYGVKIEGNKPDI
ncbi:MAG: 3-methyl-2-oxobutanoate hydroxymethyltransferase, partial [Candidatus Aenigmarchaeota archaeon]|nr:3-methyl-2-oxobutanoate hydroxymethyltransferase [Candidatus Aenigmarchaeota archaeon]